METEVTGLAVATPAVLLTGPAVQFAELVARLLRIARAAVLEIMYLATAFAAMARVAYAMRRGVPRKTPVLALAVVWPRRTPCSQFAVSTSRRWIGLHDGSLMSQPN